MNKGNFFERVMSYLRMSNDVSIASATPLLLKCALDLNRSTAGAPQGFPGLSPDTLTFEHFTSLHFNNREEHVEVESDSRAIVGDASQMDTCRAPRRSAQRQIAHV